MKYIDPSGNNWWSHFKGWVREQNPIVRSFLILPTLASIDPITFSSMDATTGGAITLGFFRDGFDGAQKSAENSFEINMGLFTSDDNRNFWGRSWQLISRFTWEGAQTSLGYLFSIVYNDFWDVDDVTYFQGATLVNRNTNIMERGGMTLGSFILGKNLRATMDDWTFLHEYGHTLQSRNWGPLYIPVIALPSGLDYWPGSGAEPWPDNPDFQKHNLRWYETGANKSAAKYFEKYYDDFEWDDSRNPRSKDIARKLRISK